MRYVNIYKGDPYEEDCVCIGFDEKLEKDSTQYTSGELKAALIRMLVKKNVASGLYWAGIQREDNGVIVIGPEYFRKK